MCCEDDEFIMFILQCLQCNFTEPRRIGAEGWPLASLPHEGPRFRANMRDHKAVNPWSDLLRLAWDIR